MSTRRDGALMITLVVTMTVLGILGAATVSIVKISGYRSVLLNNQDRAYYMTRAGMAFARANADSMQCTNKTFTLSSGEQFVLTLTNDGAFAYATVTGMADVGGVWETSTTAQQQRFEVGTGETLGEEIADDFDAPIGPGGDELGPDIYQAGWDASEEELDKSDEKRLFTTSQEVETSFGWTSSSYLTFQNFTTVNKDQGYVAKLVKPTDIDAAVRYKDYHGIWGNASDNIYVVGEDGAIVHYDGTKQDGVTWQKMTSPTTKLLRDIWGTPDVASASNPEKMVAVGDDGEIVEYINGLWSRRVNTDSGLTGFWRGDNFSCYDIYAVYGSSWNHISTYGDYGTNPYKWNGYYNRQRYNCRENRSRTYGRTSGTEWRPWYYSRDLMFKSVWEYYDGANYHIFGCGAYSGSGGFVFKEWPSSGTYTEWKAFKKVDSVNAMWGTSLLNVYAVGDDGQIFHTKQAIKGSKWRGGNEHSPTTRDLNGVYGGSEDYIFAAGDSGTILFNDGDGWDEVKAQDGNNVTPNTLNSVWGSERTGIYAVGDNGTIVYLGYPANAIGGYTLPVDNNPLFSNHWAEVKYLSYTIQAKMVWGDDLDYATSGFNFRWHLANNTTNKYAGYGVSFMRYDSSTNAYNDMIPDTIKPGYLGASEKDDRVLVVLWKQYVDGTDEKRQWLAYKDITADSKMMSGDHLKDLSTLMVRVEEKRAGGVKVNDITLYYGNAADNIQAGDSVWNNTDRRRYNPSFATGMLAGTIHWPPYTTADWSVDTDYFTLVDNVTLAAVPVANYSWIVNPMADGVDLEGTSTIRTPTFTSPDAEPFGTQEERPEIALHVFGDIGDYGSQELVSFSEFRIQLGVNK